jgi:ABC-type nitrate/sulfonate/bicarbonate transport system permease component
MHRPRLLRGWKLDQVLLGAGGALLVAAALELSVRSGFVSKFDMPPVTTIFPRFVHLAQTGEFWRWISQTVEQALQGLGIATVIAIPLGFAVGSKELLWRGLRPTIEFLRPVPGVALIPLVTLVWGPRPKSVIVLCVFVCVWPILVQAIYGVREVDDVARDAARAYGLGPTRRAVRLVLPSALPFLATGLRLAASAALIMAVTVEYLAGAPGLGQQLTLAQSGGNGTQLYALVLTSALLGLVVNVLLGRAERRLLRWSPTHRAA